MHDTELILADGTRFSGRGFGKSAPDPSQLLSLNYEQAPIGELVFNTSMGVYHEIITDPSYAGQSIVMTSPHIGNYGTNPEWNEMLHIRPQCKALIVRDLYDGPVASSRTPLDEMCMQWKLSGISEIDTRALTLHIRTKGSQYGVLVRRTDDLEQHLATIVSWIASCPPMADRDFVSTCSVSSVQVFAPQGSTRARYALWDFGTKKSIISQLVQQHIEVTVFPCSTKLSDIFVQGHRFDALFLSNGPGDPATLSAYVDQLKHIIGTTAVLGICLGHQLAAMALGAKTEKMLFGHHGSNHPIRDLNTGGVYVTAQNHGYCVDSKSLPKTTEVWLINDNDGSLEGLYDKERGVMTVQFHPEAAPGPWEGRALFKTFVEWVEHTQIVQEAHHAR